jgi:hypothetical protein
VKEEDNNTGEGNELVPQLPPPPCVGDLHTVPPLPDFPDFPYTGQQMPLCDKRLVTLQARQNAGLDIFLFTTDAPYSLNNPGSSWTSAQAVPPPGRFFGLVENNIHRNLDPQSITYGELRSVPGVPIGIYEYGEPVSPGGPRSAVGRRLRTVFADENGFYEVLLPSTATFNTPIPGGVSPAMYVMVINDPGSDPANPNPSYSKANLSDTYVFDAWPGKMTPTDTPVEPSTSEVCGAPPDAPQLFHVSAPNNAGPVVTAGQNTNITITGFRFGNTQAGPPTVTLDSNDLDTTPGVQLPLVSWTPADPAVQRFEDVVVVTVPSTFPAGPAQLLLRSGPVVDVVNGQTTGLQVSRNGMTIHVRGGNYNPTLVYVNPPASGITCDPAVPGTCVIQDAINSAAVVALTAPPPLIVVRPGTYRENVIFHKRVTLQGFGPGGEAGAGNVEVTDFPCATLPCPNFTLPTEEPFTHIPGTVIDGRFFHFVQGKRGAWQTTLTTQASPFAGPATVPAGAGITVVANTTEFGAEGGVAARLAPRIDGFGIITSRGEAGGGIYVHAFGRNLIISNNILDANTGTHGGAISLGQPLVRGGLANHQNDRIRIHHNRMLSSGGVFFAGAVGIFGGADNYRFDNNDVCGGFSAEYGGCFSHWGRSPGANIHDNRFYYCEAVDEGGGLMISGGDMTPAPLGPGSGTVTIARNLIQSNLSWDDGGGIRLLRPLGGTANRVNIINNMIVNNVATDFGGGIALDDAANVVIVNNTIASNVSTQTAEDSNLGEAHGAGIASELHSPAFLATLPAGSPRFSSPVLFNNIIFDNLAYRWGMMTPEDGSPRPGLVPTAYIDLEVVDGLSATDCLAVNYSFLSRRHLSPTGSLCPAGTGNIFADGGDPATLTLPSPDPLFIRPLTAGQVDIVVAGGRFNPNELIPFLHRTEGMLLGFTDYHLQGAPAFPANSLAINAGINALGGVSAPTNDFDGNTRPQRGTLFDMGADEVLP